jgi:hypothetical protein
MIKQAPGKAHKIAAFWQRCKTRPGIHCHPVPVIGLDFLALLFVNRVFSGRYPVLSFQDAFTFARCTGTVIEAAPAGDITSFANPKQVRALPAHNQNSG